MRAAPIVAGKDAALLRKEGLVSRSQNHRARTLVHDSGRANPFTLLDRSAPRCYKPRMSMLKEFKDFINRGNVVDLAVGVVIGAAFGRIVSSLVEDLLMPPIGKILGNLDFSNFYIPLSDKVAKGLTLVEAKKLGPVVAYGNFLTVLLNFVIVAFCIFLVVKGVNTIKKLEAPQPAKPASDPKDVILLQEILDVLKSGARRE
jgi:large conductance mechanosensitive channel